MEPRFSMANRRTKAEQETILRYDASAETMELWTAYLPDARRWRRLGYPVQVASTYQDGEPSGWKATVPKACLRLRRIVGGSIVKRRSNLPRKASTQ
jgi:hypothetical protein